LPDKRIHSMVLKNAKLVMLKKVFKSKAVTYLIYGVILLYMFLILHFCRKKIVFKGKAEDIMLGKKPVIVAAWHSRFMPMVGLRQYGCFQAVTSAHKDGNYMQMALEHFGHTAIRGSSRKHAQAAMRAILKIKPEEMRLVITPDGPIGPRFKVKGGLVRIAARYKAPIIPMSYSATHAIVLKTWDRFIIPIPFISKIIIEFGNETHESTSDERLEQILLRQMKNLDKKCNLNVDY